MTAADTYPTWPDVLQWHTVSGASPDDSRRTRFTYDDGTLKLHTEVLVPVELRTDVFSVGRHWGKTDILAKFHAA